MHGDIVESLVGKKIESGRKDFLPLPSFLPFPSRELIDVHRFPSPKKSAVLNEASSNRTYRHLLQPSVHRSAGPGFVPEPPACSPPTGRALFPLQESRLTQQCKAAENSGW